MSMSNKMSQVIGAGRTRPISTLPHYGIELEYENCQGTVETKGTHWACIGDGSLRNNGIELVSIPLTAGQVSTALVQAKAFVDKHRLVATERCGLHFHINMHPYTLGQFFSFVTAYALIEPTIFATYAEGRENSAFCVPLYNNTALIQRLSYDNNAVRRVKNVRTNSLRTCMGSSKYSAINVSSLGKFGTVEFRQPYCTRDIDAILNWTQFCQRLERWACDSFTDPSQVLDFYANHEVGGLQELLMGTTVDVSDSTQEKASDAATFIAGYEPPHWRELDWELHMTRQGG